MAKKSGENRKESINLSFEIKYELLPQMSEIIEKLNVSLDAIRPYLKEDGGDVEVMSIDDEGVVRIKMIGNCKTCMQRNSTIKTGIESVLKSQFPEIKEVIEG